MPSDVRAFLATAPRLSSCRSSGTSIGAALSASSFFLYFVERRLQSITFDEHLIGPGQRFRVRDHLTDAVLLQLGFDEIDQLPRCHRVQFDPLITQKTYRYSDRDRPRSAGSSLMLELYGSAARPPMSAVAQSDVDDGRCALVGVAPRIVLQCVPDDDAGRVKIMQDEQRDIHSAQMFVDQLARRGNAHAL